HLRGLVGRAGHQGGARHGISPALGTRSRVSRADRRPPALKPRSVRRNTHAGRGDAVTGVRAPRSLPVVASRASCTSETCVTCGEVAVEVTVIRRLPAAMAVVDTGSGEEEVSITLVDAGPGDTVLVHAGEAIAMVRR